jgi:hypothetical protein
MRYISSRETLIRIIERIENRKPGIYLRFGDGDVNLANNTRELMQQANDKLAAEMREAFALNGDGVMKCLPVYCHKYGAVEPGMCPGNHEAPNEWVDDIIRRAKPHWGGEIDEVYPHVALCYTATVEAPVAKNFLNRMRDTNCKKIFVGNRTCPESVIERMFGKCHIIKTPEANSYDGADAAWEEFQRVKTDEYTLAIFAMGCSGRAVQKRIWKKYSDCFVFDVGSIMDTVYGNSPTRAWMEITKFNGKKFLETL